MVIFAQKSLKPELNDGNTQRQFILRSFERFAEPQRRSRRTTFGSQTFVGSSMLLLCRAVILSTHHNREITVKATAWIDRAKP